MRPRFDDHRAGGAVRYRHGRPMAEFRRAELIERVTIVRDGVLAFLVIVVIVVLAIALFGAPPTGAG